MTGVLLCFAALAAACLDDAAPPALVVATASAPVAQPTATPAADSGTDSLASPLLPQALEGRWTPQSKALQGPGELTLTARTLTWAPCGEAPRAAAAETTGDTVLLTLSGTPSCVLDGQPVSHLRLLPRADQVCEMEVSVFENAEQLERNERLAWSVYIRADCRDTAR